MPGHEIIGRRLGDYAIIEILGQGGMAHVYKGYDANLDRYAAVKVISPGTVVGVDEQEYRERFLREARAIARLSHPRIVNVYQFNQTDDNLYYMAMMFIDGRDLRQILKDFIRRGKRIPYKRVLRIMSDIADALDYAHRQGVIHRDVKPSNIMVTNDGHAVLTDFGLALNASEGTLGNTFGSVHYIAPEQAVSSKQASPQSDLYSLGVVLYELLTGRVPFDDDSAMSVALKHISDPPPPARLLNPDVTAQLEAVLNKALDKDPQRRFKSGSEFIMALTSAFASSPILDTQELQDSQIRPPLASGTSGAGGDPTADRVSRLATARPTPPASSDSGKHKTPVDAKPEIRLNTRQRAGHTNEELDLIQNAKTVTDSSRSSAMRNRIQETMQPGSQASNRMLLAVVVLIVVLLVGGTLLLIGNGTNQNQGGAGTDSAGEIAAGVTETAAQPSTAETTGSASAIPVSPTTISSDSNSTAVVVVAVASDLTATDAATATATATEMATEAATLTASPTRTHTPTSTLTATASPSPSSSPGMTATPALEAAADEPAILLRYNGQSLVLYNRGPQQRLNVSDLDFVQTGAEGTPLSFNSDAWGAGNDNLYALRPRDCFQLWTPDIVRLSATEFPADICNFRQAFQQTTSLFWINPAAAGTFTVLRDDVPLATCPTVPATSEIEVRCVVPLP